jgi:hypothetical protein
MLARALAALLDSPAPPSLELLVILSFVFSSFDLSSFAASLAGEAAETTLFASLS